MWDSLIRESGIENRDSLIRDSLMWDLLIRESGFGYGISILFNASSIFSKPKSQRKYIIRIGIFNHCPVCQIGLVQFPVGIPFGAGVGKIQFDVAKIISKTCRKPIQVAHDFLVLIRGLL